MVPLKWAEGDPCITRGQRGVVESLGPECATVRINEARVLFVGLDELELVPLPEVVDVVSNPIEPIVVVEGVDHEQGILGARAQRRGEAEGEADRGSVRSVARHADDAADAERSDRALSAGTRARNRADEARRGVLLRKEGDVSRAESDQHRSDVPLTFGDYDSFVSRKLTRQPPTGLGVIPELHPSLFPFQRDLVSWALRRGRAALFADTGLGKTAMQLEWARRVHEATKRDVLILAPLAVAAQTAREGERLGVVVTVCRSEADVAPGLNITNYDRLHRFDPTRFGAVVLDESSIIKHHDAKTLAVLLEAFRATPFRLCATATPSPNDYTELGTHAEFLGVCTRAEMLAEYFVHDGGSTQDWRLKGHARGAFWRWMSTWAALLRKPSDLGYDDAGYDLPELRVTQHTIESDLANINATKEAGAQTSLFVEPAKTLTERRTARKGSLGDRVKQCAATVLAEPDEAWVIWCELNAEADALARALPGAVEIRGSDEPILKESRLVGFGRGEFKWLITKPSIAGFGLNWQHAARMAFVGVKDSWEAYYQAIRREWRFGQKRPVHVHVFASELEGEVVKNLQRKERDALVMAEQLSAETRETVRAEVRGLTRQTNDYKPAVAMTVPAWMKETA